MEEIKNKKKKLTAKRAPTKKPKKISIPLPPAATPQSSGLSLGTRKLIMWTGTIIVFLIILSFWISAISHGLTTDSNQSNGLPNNAFADIKSNWEKMTSDFSKNLDLIKNLNQTATADLNATADINTNPANATLDNQAIETLKEKILEKTTNQ